MLDRKIVQVINNRCFWITEFKSMDQVLEMYPLDVLFVDAPSYVTTEWGYDPSKEGDDRFTEPVAPEGFYFDRETGNIYPNEMKEVLLQQEYTKKQAENKEKLAIWLAMNPVQWKDGKNYGITFEDQQEISLNMQQYQLQCQIRENQENIYNKAVEANKDATERKQKAQDEWDAATAETERRAGLTEEEAAAEQKARDDYKEATDPYQKGEDGEYILDDAGEKVMKGYRPAVYQKDEDGNLILDENENPIVLIPTRPIEPEPLPEPEQPNTEEGDGQTADGEEPEVVEVVDPEPQVDGEGSEGGTMVPAEGDMPPFMPMVENPDPYNMRMKDDPFEGLTDPATIEIPEVPEPNFIRPMLQWHAIHEGCVDWNIDELTELAAMITAKVYPALNLMYCFKEQIYGFTTKEQIRAFNPDYRVLDPSDEPPMPPEWLPGEGPDAEKEEESEAEGNE